MKTELLKNAPHAFQALHSILGFDFCKPYGIAHLSGPYTGNKAMKTAAAGGWKYGDTLAILTRNPASALYDRKYKLVTLETGGNVEIEYRPWQYYLDWFSTKGDFHTVRKAEKADTFIIWQAREYINKPVEKKPDLSARFVFVKADYCSWKGQTNVTRLELKRTDAAGEKYTHKYMAGNAYYASALLPIPASPAECIDKSGYLLRERRAECIDKSGYLLRERRAELHRKADALRAEREKAAADAEDNAGRVQELSALLDARRAELVQALTAADTADALETVGKALVGFGFSGLAEAAHKLERFKDKAERKAFASIAARDEEYNRILQALTKEG